VRLPTLSRVLVAVGIGGFAHGGVGLEHAAECAVASAPFLTSTGEFHVRLTNIKVGERRRYRMATGIYREF
jgi:hypothetical protein